MRAKTTNFRWIAGAAAAIFCLAASPALAQETRAVINPSRITLDEAAELRLPSEGGGAVAPPSVPGLAFQAVGQSSEMTSVNGRVSQQTWTLYQVSASQPGTYSIPVGGERLTLTVTPGGSQPSPGAGAQSRARLPQEAADPASGPIAFLRTRRPAGRFYVGQAIPISFKAYFRPGTEITISALPTLSSPAFTVSDVSEKPVQSRQLVGGREYEVATWTAMISGAMPGTYPGEVTLPITARYREESRSTGSQLDDLFANDPMASSMFKSMFGGSGFPSGFGASFGDPFGQIRERQLTLRSPADPLTLLPLPSAGKPPGFTGAVGHFDLTVALTPATGTAFEPMSLKVEVSGEGNFDRVTLPGLGASPEFKSYPATSRFVSRTPRSTFTGTKAFVQPIVPEHAGQLELPAIAFSYFDPKTAAYVTTSTLPLHASVAAAAGPTTNPTTVAAPAAEAVAADGLRPDRDPSGEVTTLQLPERQPWFWLALALPFLGLGIALTLRRRRGPSGRAKRRELRANLAAQRLEMRRAVQRRDAPGFFDSARAALQTELGDLWSLPPDQVTESEIRRRLGGRGRLLADALNTAELLRYGVARVDADSLPELDANLERALNQLEVACGRVMKSSLKSLANFRRIVGAGLAAAALGLAATSAAQAANPWTASRLYNQANADARGGKYGAAILGYRRAELLAPRDPDIATNLAWVRARAGLPARAEPWFRRADRALSLAGWTGLWLGTLWLLCAALTLVATAQRGRRLWLGCAVAAAVAALGSGAGFALANVELRTAVVTARQGTDLRLSPFADAASEGRLGEGASLRTDAQHGTYLHVRGGDGRQGWIDSVAVEPLVPGTS